MTGNVNAIMLACSVSRFQNGRGSAEGTPLEVASSVTFNEIDRPVQHPRRASKLTSLQRVGRRRRRSSDRIRSWQIKNCHESTRGMQSTELMRRYN